MEANLFGATRLSECFKLSKLYLFLATNKSQVRKCIHIFIVYNGWDDEDEKILAQYKYKQQMKDCYPSYDHENF